VVVVDEVVDAAKNQLVRHIPVAGREGQGCGDGAAFGAVAGVEPERHVGARLAVENDVEAGLAAGFRGGGAATAGGDGESGGVVVVDVGGGDVGAVKAVVVGVGAGGGGGDDGVGDVVVLEGVVDATDGDLLGRIPIGGGEGEAGSEDDAFGGVGAAQADGDVG